MANSKTIGNAYERDFAKKLSKWLTQEDDKLVCWRDAHSGSIQTIIRKRGGKVTGGGDLSCIDPEYQWFFDKVFIDTKSLSEVDFYINSNNAKSNQFFAEWRKVVNDCNIGNESNKTNKIPLMPTKVRKKGNEFLVFPTGALKINYNYKFDFSVQDIATKNMYNFTIVPFIDFITYNRPEEIFI